MRLALVLVVLMAGSAWADDWHAGLNLRSELGTHPIRIDGGARLGRVDLIAVLDPMWWTDSEVDIDLLASVRVTESGYGVLAGWRPASIAIGDERQFQHALLLGATGPLPNLGPVTMTWGLELSAVVYTHGGGVPSEMLSLDSMSSVGDHFNASMFLRVGYASAL